MKHLLFFLCILLIGSNVYSQKKAFDPQKSNGNLYEYAEFSDVGNQIFSIHDILKNTFLKYTVVESDHDNLGFTSNNYWLRFKLQNSSENTMVYYLETARPVTDIANLYQISDNTIQHYKSGDKMAFNNKQVPHRSTIFKLTLPPQETQQIYIHLKSDGETINLPLNLYSESSFWLINYKQQLFLGLFYGLLFLAGIIYLFFFSSLNEKVFLYYGIYVFSIALMQAALDGFMHEYILPSGGYLNDRAVLITALLSTFFLLKYCEFFLRIGFHLKKFTTITNVLYAFIAMIFIMLFINESTFEMAYLLANLNGLVSFVFILVTIGVMLYNRIRIDPYFSIGILCLAIGLLGFIMNNLSLLPNNFFTLNSAKLGSAFEVIFLSLSMTNLIRELRLEKEKSQQEALKKSEEISQLKTYFMSNMSHELRTPINAIMGIAEYELEIEKNKESIKSYEIIKNAALSLLSNVNDILDFEKIENNQLQLNSADFNPYIRLLQISNNWKAEAHNKGLDYRFEMYPEIPTAVYADAERFTQIINNVLSNAVKYTETGNVKLKINCINQPNDMCLFLFQVSDTGIGIPPESKDSIFDSFSQMRLGHKRKFGGIGLGLAIANHIVGLFGGQLKIESELNKGTDVFIELPLKCISQERIEIASDRSKDLPLHILIVEDNKMNQMVMRKTLSSFSNISCDVTNNGQEAIEALKKDIYDIVLMDLQMPVMDGYEATRIIRSGELGKAIHSIPIIAVTADAMQETKKRVLDVGMDDYMTKPVNRDLLLAKIYTFNFDKNHVDDTNDCNDNLKIA